MEPTNGALEDYLAEVYLDGNGTTWRQNRGKIDFVLRRASGYLKKAATVCEIGLGEGYLLRKLAEMGLKITGIDISTYLIEALGKRFKAESIEVDLLQGNVADMDLPENSFDLVFCLDVLEHIPGDGLRKTIQALRQAMTNGGVLVATLPVGEILANNMVMCPKCRHVFHRIGHHHAFDSMLSVQEMLAPDFSIIRSVHIPFDVFSCDALNRTAHRLYRFLRRTVGFKERGTVCFFAEPSRPCGAPPAGDR